MLRQLKGIVLCFASLAADFSRAGEPIVTPPEPVGATASNSRVNPFDWPNEPPPGCPQARSQEIRGIRFTGRRAKYTNADTWYLAWAKDGDCYSCWTDGHIGNYVCASNPWGGNKEPCNGQARIAGNDPLSLKVYNLGKMYGRYDFCHPCVSVIANDVFYLGWQRTKNLESFKNGKPSGPGDPRGLYYDGVRYSTDWNHFTEALKPGWKNKYWVNASDPDRNFFKEQEPLARFRYPHAVYLGRDNSLSPDGNLYFTSHGAATGSEALTWEKGDAIYLCRVAAEIKSVTDAKAYEFWNGSGWSKQLAGSRPILAWKNRLGSESMTYIPGLRKYILMSARLCENEKNLDYNCLLFYESDAITGPYKLVHGMRDFGPQCYFPHIPPKFISADGKKAWFCYSANYSAAARKQENPPGSGYALCLQEMEFLLLCNPARRRSEVRLPL